MPTRGRRSVPEGNRAVQLATDRETAGAVHSFATVLITLGLFDLALEHANDALTIYRALGDRPGMAMCLNTLAIAAIQHDQLADAATATNEAVTLHEALVAERPDLDHTQSLTTLSTRYAALGSPDRAVTAAHDAVETAHSLVPARPLAVSLIGYVLRCPDPGGTRLRQPPTTRPWRCSGHSPKSIRSSTAPSWCPR